MWLLFIACADKAPDTGWDRGPNPHPLDDLLRLNHVQAEGTHNSYHVRPDVPVDSSHEYTHAPLSEQVGQLGVRQLELDLHLHEGAGWQVFHLPVVDEETVCLALDDCLVELKAWSDAAGWHLPLMVWLEPKDDVDGLVEELLPLAGRIAEIDEAILATWPRERIFTPDDLRGDHADLPAALAADGWPRLGEVRGKVLFALLDSGDYRDEYLDGAPALQGRLMFVDSAPGDPFAATIKDGGAEDVAAWVDAGYLVTVNAAGADDSDADNEAEWAAALATGAHFVATDFAGPVDGRTFEAVIPGGSPARCNPRVAPAECTAAAVESLP